MDTVWHAVDRELERRKSVGEAPGTWAALARDIGESQQTVNNWKRRGIPPRQHAAIAQSLGWSTDELLGLTVRKRLAQSVSLEKITVPTLIEWGEVVSEKELPAVFEVQAPDDAMAPRVRVGQTIKFDRTIEPRPGDGVLVRDASGAPYFRLYRAGRPGEWEAHALNEAYRPLDSVRDGLQVIAVLVGVNARWA
jgi:hypothetical protein